MAALCLRGFQVSRQRETTKKTKSQNFSPDVKVNCAIKDGDWKQLYCNGMTLEELADDISQFYQLSEFVSDRLEFHYAVRTRISTRGHPERPPARWRARSTSQP